MLDQCRCTFPSGPFKRRRVAVRESRQRSVRRWQGRKTNLRTVVIIPARLQSRRLPNKPLADLGGLPMVVRVARQAQRAPNLAAIYVATGDAAIAAAARRHGLAVLATPGDHPSGSDRVAAAMAQLPAAVDAIINLQGDEPFVDPRDLEALARALEADDWDMVTLCRPLPEADAWRDPNVVKVTRRNDGGALLFSRAPIPHPRDGLADDRHAPPGALRHLGVYAWRRRALAEQCRHPPHPLELCEGLEQLRALACGYRIRVIDAVSESRGIDTPADLAWARARIETLGPHAFT